jgi:hypothetical protein
MNPLHLLGCSLALVLVVAVVPPAHAVGLEDEVNLLLKRLRSEELRDLAKQKAKDLTGTDALVRRKAVLFFHDLRAKGVLVELLFSEDNRETVADSCLDVLDLESLPRVYELLAATLPAPGTLETGGERTAARNGFVARVNQAAAKVLQIDAVEMKDYDALELHLTWAKMLQAAKQKNPRSADLDRLQKKVSGGR